ncbi:MAG: FprA family A-type flavoprotein [Candidatus Omnitrophica bacterium]|nr:FprA family A-type flavoprotein [Candidatus Omnitrophota bacterium]
MKALEIKKNVYWVGGIDWTLRNFHGYSTKSGSSYNAYLILGEKKILIDTVKEYLFDEMLSRIESVCDPASIDIIVSNHTEMDHSGSIEKLCRIAKNAVVMASPNGEKGLKKHFFGDLNIKPVASGETLDCSDHKLQFFHMPMVHWPDSMATYCPEKKILFPNDAFGQHIASTERYDDEMDFGFVKQEATKYYANIVLPYGSQVNAALGALGGLDFDIIAPSHGLIWRKHIPEILALYKKWSDNETENRGVIVYDSMWHSTERIAYALYDAFCEKKIFAELSDLKTNDISDLMTKILEARYIFVGSPTLNNGMLPTVGGFLTYLKGLAPKKRVGMAFGSYGWGGQSIGQIETVLKDSGFAMLDSIKVQYVPDKAVLKGITERVTKLL